ncbi:hypothetical protein AAFX22_13660 [Vibrio alginolyticus]|uniref:hypothetical protein n=1 Tax=Vibrio alginolyticus TaxID=663 RepID=UPI0038CD309E
MKPDLHGSRIVLRSIQMDDSDDLFEIYGDIQTMEFASESGFSIERYDISDARKRRPIRKVG